MASMKNANPSAENGRPKMPPEKAMNLGQRRPSSKESTVPETAPTANRMANALDHRLASTIHASSWRHRASPSATDMSSGIPTPSTAKTMWNPSDVPIVARASTALLTMFTLLAPGSARQRALTRSSLRLAFDFRAQTLHVIGERARPVACARLILAGHSLDSGFEHGLLV